MKPVPRHRHLVGYKSDRFAEQRNEVDELQRLFAAAIPQDILDFLTTLPDCVLYYRFDATTKSGRAKTYSHFVTTNIGPELESFHPFPASLIGRILRCRSLGMGLEYLPFMMEFGKTTWLYCKVGTDESPVCVPKGDREFGTSEREWTVIAPGFEAFVDGLQLDLRPHLSAFRLVGTGNVNQSMREWFVAAVGEDWEMKVQTEIPSKRKNST